jgi:PAS domain S-box-containing protein
MKTRQNLYLLLLPVVAAVYIGSAKLGLSLAFRHPVVSPVWPTTGLAMVCVWLFGYRISPAILLGAFLANLLSGVSAAAASGIAIGNTLEALSAVFMLRRFVGRVPFYRTPDALKFVVVVALSTMVSASVGNASLCLSGFARWEEFGPLWLTWWLGDAVGALVVAPLLLTWLDRTSARWSIARIAEGALLLLLTAGAATVVFIGLFLPRLARDPLEHLIVPFLLWAAFRFGPRGAATILAVLSLIAVWGTRQGSGPFAEPAPNESLLLLQVFVAAVAIMTLVLAAIVTERKQTEEALRAKEAQLRLITDITPVMLAQCGRSERYSFANRAYAEYFGLQPEQLIGRHVTEILGDEAYKSIRPYIDAALAGQAIEHEIDVPYKHAGHRFMRVAYKPDGDAQGNIVGWVASLSDITDRKQTEEQINKLNSELQRRIDEFKTLIDTAPVGIGVALDAECRDIWANHEFARMLGSDPQQNLSKSATAADALPFKVYCDGHEVAPDDLPMQRACREGREVLDEEMAIVRNDGRVVYELCRATPLKDEQGRVRGCIGVFLDITERKQVEQEREHLLLREHAARASAEAANRVKDEFLATISHELRTPLNSIMGWAQLLRTGSLDTTNVARGLETIERNARAQAQLVDDLLDISRIVNGKLRLNVSPVEFAGLINAAIDMVRPAASAKAIEVEFSDPPETIIIAGDPARLQQIVWNLLSNAIKFTPRGGRVEVRFERIDNNVRLTVADNGEGIALSFLPYVFDRFRQADSSRTRKHGGLGLGLAIVRHLTEMHGGTVEVTSPGERRGSIFTITLPLGAGANGAANSNGEPRAEPSMPLPLLVGIRLLLVEDDADSLAMLRIVVESQGAAVSAATKTSEALNILERWWPHVLISDIGLPDEDGYALIAKARRRARESGRYLPAIAFTGYAGEQEGQRALAAGFQMYFTKPTEPSKLIAAIVRLAAQAEKRQDA